MAVKDDGALYPTDAIVSKRARKHYRVPVRSQHWQLRSLISVEKQNVVYFPGGHGSRQIQRLDTATRACETVKQLTFAPRCLVAESGWLCCGSENGDFVAIRLDEGSNTGSNSSTSPALDPDARLPLGLDSTSSTEESILALFAHTPNSSTKIPAKSMKLAKERVNCITLWFPPTKGPADENAYTEPIAVLANNDRTVTLVSLNDFDQNEKTDPLDIISYPDFVNRAVISPDGGIMVAILDDPYLYVHQRTPAPSESRQSHTHSPSESRWELKQSLLLKSQRKDDKTDSRGSFAACFSPSGAYLAVGTQHGTISIFDASRLTDETLNPLITTFQSSRPNSGPGAIRDMTFCPGPYDILAWTEDRGHVGVADMRSGFMIRQIVDINVEADFEHISIFDSNTIDPRLLARRETSSAQPSVNMIGDALRRRERDGLDRLNHPLTPSEMRVLEAIQGDRRRRERPTQTNNDEGGHADAQSTWAYSGIIPRSAVDGEAPRPRERSSSVSRTMGDLIGTYRDQRERAQERVRSARQLLRETGDRPLGTRRGDQRWMDRLSETVAAMRDQRDRQDSSYLSVLEILQARERPPADATDLDDSSLLVPLVNQVVNRWEESAIRGTLAPDHGVFEVPPSPDNTAGLSWSPDGRTLFVGAQNGIYELQLNTQNRKFCPSITLR